MNVVEGEIAYPDLIHAVRLKLPQSRSERLKHPDFNGHIPITFGKL